MMTTTNDTISFHSATHGTFKVKADHLDMTASAHSGWSITSLLNKAEALTGYGDYSDLRFIEALILISYLTGGVAD